MPRLLLIAAIALASDSCTPRHGRGAPEGPAVAGSPAPLADAPRRGAPVYEGCFIRFDRSTPTPAAAGAEGAPGHLEIEFTLDPESHGDFVALELELLDCAGAGHGFVRDGGWRRVGPSSASTNLVTLDPTSPRLVASGDLPPGEYHRVFAAVDAAVGLRGDGDRQRLNAHVEPIARPFTLEPGGRDRVRVTVDRPTSP